MELNIAQKLSSENLISHTQEQNINIYYKNKSFSLHWELRTLLFTGLTLFMSGIGILVYMNIDTIGHLTLIILIGLACTGLFFYSFKKCPPYSNLAVEKPSHFFDYIVLAACLLFITLETYLQYQYRIFGDRYNLATIIPSLLFIYLAYKFDHKAILSLAITGLASAIGLTVTPLDLIDGNNFSSDSLIYIAIVFAGILGLTGWLLRKKGIKQHFTFTYYNFASNIAFVATLAGLFDTDIRFVFFLLLLAFGFIGFRYAQHEKSAYFLFISIIYTYIGFTYYSVYILDKISDRFWGEGGFYLALMYFIGTCFGIVQLFRNYKKLLGIV